MQTHRSGILLFVLLFTFSSCSTIRYNFSLKEKINQNGYVLADTKEDINSASEIKTINSYKQITYSSYNNTIKIKGFNKQSFNKINIAKDDSCAEIILINGTIINAKILESAGDEIKYYRCDHLSDSLITIEKKIVGGIRYVDGTVEQFNDISKENTINESDYNTNESNQTKKTDDRKVDGFAIASFTFGLIGILMIWLLPSASLVGIVISTLGFVFGIIGLSRILKNREKYKGLGFAIAGGILGGVVFITVLVYILLYAFS